MKKFLAIFVVFTLIAGVAFADTSFGGGFGYRVYVANGDSDSDDVGSAIANKASNLNVNFSGENWGGTFHVYANQSNGEKDLPTTTAIYWSVSPFGFVWWKPFEQFRIQVGHNPDGDWGAAAITGWGFDAEAQDYVAFDDWVEHSFALGGADKLALFFFPGKKLGFYPGFNASGVAMSILPADGVAINIGIPFGGGGHGDGSAFLYQNLAYFHVNAAIQIGEVGKLNLSFKGGEGLMEQPDGWDGISPGNIYASFNLTQIENLGVDIGVDFPLPYNNAADKSVVDPIGLGLGVTYDAGDFGVKFRAGLALPQSIDGETKAGVTVLGFNILPYYTLLDGALTAYLNAGLGFGIYDDSDKNITTWFVNPYIKVPAGGLNFYAGIQLFGVSAYKGYDPDSYNNHPFKEKSKTWWNIPIGFQLYF